MGTAQFLIYMSVFVAAWLCWNTFMPPAVQFDPRELNYTLLTLIPVSYTHLDVYKRQR